MTTLDWGVLLAYVVSVLGLSLHFRRRAGRSTAEFIVAGRALPWWLAGTSMIAGQFGADSPLHQTRKIRETGLPGAWFYWAGIAPQVINAIVFAKLWRRTALLTPVEFYDLRYDGRGRDAGRIWAVVYNAFIEQPALAALGLIALVKISTVMFDLPPSFQVAGVEVSTALTIVVGALLVQLAYSALSGVWGVVSTEVVEFGIAMTASYSLAFIVYREVGWATGLRAGLERLGEAQSFSVVPTLGVALFVYLCVQPFTMAWGQTAIAQRFLSITDEREAALSGIWRVVNHFILRTWPWYVCGLCAVILLPDLARTSEHAYPMLVRTYLPAGLLGLMMTAFFAGAIGQGSHTSAAIVVNDLYRPYVRPHAPERHYVLVSRLAVVAFTVVTATIATTADGILGLLMLLMKLQAGVGLLMALRWFWGRVNGWADLTAQLVALPVALFYENDTAILRALFGMPAGPVEIVVGGLGLSGIDNVYAVQYLFTLVTCTVLWLLVMLLTPPEPAERLDAFYARIRPYGAWGPSRRRTGLAPHDSVRRDASLCAVALALAFSMVFAIGALIMGRWATAAVLAVTAVGAGATLVRALNRSVGAAPAVPPRPVAR